MKAGGWWLFAFGLAVTLTAACKPAEVPISGDIFIVTRGGPSIKLGLVTVAAFDEAAALRALDAYQTAQRPAWVAASAELKTAEAVLDESRNAYEKTEAATSDPRIKKSALQNWGQSLDAVSDAQKKVDAIVAAPAVLEALGEPVTTTKTNADGAFSFKLRVGHRYLIAAQSRRDLPEPESYVWLIAIAPMADASRLMLSNDNVLSAGPAESPIDFAAWLQMLPEATKPLRSTE